MHARRILVLYGTSYGQTAKIAERIASHLAASGDDVRLTDIAELPRGTAPSDFDGVVIGASVLGGKHQRAVRDFARRHHVMLNAMPSAFFSVTASAAGGEAMREDVYRLLSEFRRETGWYPVLSEGVAGALAYTRYNPIIRWMMKRIAAKAGGPTDTTRDHELTDWAQVDRFADAFERMVVRAQTEPHPEPAFT
jgi:menaquinone-dependent protoporphyrinogen oxidase